MSSIHRADFPGCEDIKRYKSGRQLKKINIENILANDEDQMFMKL